MAKTKKAPVAKAAGFTDKEGYRLAIGDQVRYEVTSSPNNGRHGILTAIHEREQDAVATVEFLCDSSWQAAPAMPAFSENLVFISREGFAVGERARVAWDDSKLRAEAKTYTGHEGRVASVLGNGPFPDIIQLEFDDATLEDRDFEATNLLRTAMAPALPEPPPIEEESDLPFLNQQPKHELALSMGAWDLLETTVERGALNAHAPDFTAGHVLNELVAAGLVELLPLANGSSYVPTAAGIAAAQEQPEVPRTPLAEASDAYKAGLRLVPLASIVVTTNTRRVFDETELQGLADSIRESGLRQNLVLRPRPVTSPVLAVPYEAVPGEYELVCGGRRYKACQMVGIEQVPALVDQLTDKQFLEIQLLENLQRVDVRPADEAQAFSKLLANGYSAEEIGLKVGKGEKFVLQRAKLAELKPFWMDLLMQERLPLVAAYELARLPVLAQGIVQQRIEAGCGYELKNGKAFQGGTISSYIRQEVLRDLDSAPWDKADANLWPPAGPCTTCPKRSGACRGLFDDLAAAGKSDTCLDAACFTKKKELAIQKARVLATEQGTAMVSDSYDNPPKGAVGTKYWSYAKEGDKGAVQALLVDGHSAGKLKWVKLSKPVQELPQDRKTEREAAIRKNRVTRQANELKADMLRQLFSNQLIGSEKGGDGIHALLNHWIRRDLEFGKSRTPNAMLDYLQAQYGWEKPTVADLDTTTDKNQTWIDGDLNTPHRAYVVRQLAKMTLVADKLILYFDLKFRNGLEQSEVLQVQDTLIKRLPTSYQDEFNVTAKAEKLVQERYYSKGKKEGATA